MTFPIHFEKHDPGLPTDSWWIDHSRESFTEAAAREAVRMRLSRIAQSVKSVTVGQIPLRGSR